MFSVVQIVRDNAATYYDFRTGEKLPRWRTYTLFILTAFLASLAVGVPSSDFLAGALSAEAILVGFSFNVLFYLVANRRVKPAFFVDIEHEIRFKKLSKLSDEIFANVSYFNVVAIFSALSALIGLMIVSNDFIPNIRIIMLWVKAQNKALGGLVIAMQPFVRVTFFALVILLLTESVAVFLRTVGRVSYYFVTLKTMDADVEAQPCD